jgi:hypothetical protein
LAGPPDDILDDVPDNIPDGILDDDISETRTTSSTTSPMISLTIHPITCLLAQGEKDSTSAFVDISNEADTSYRASNVDNTRFESSSNLMGPPMPSRKIARSPNQERRRLQDSKWAFAGCTPVEDRRARGVGPTKKKWLEIGWHGGRLGLLSLFLSLCVLCIRQNNYLRQANR